MGGIIPSLFNNVDKHIYFAILAIHSQYHAFKQSFHHDENRKRK